MRVQFFFPPSKERGYFLGDRKCYSVCSYTVLISDLCQVLSGIEILIFFLILHNDSLFYICRIVQQKLLSRMFLSHWPWCSKLCLLNDQGANCLLAVGSWPNVLFLDFANNASFWENNESCSSPPSLLTVWIIASSLHVRLFFPDRWWHYTEFISTVN